jgi:hypothetical protein
LVPEKERVAVPPKGHKCLTCGEGAGLRTGGYDGLCRRDKDAPSPRPDLFHRTSVKSSVALSAGFVPPSTCGVCPHSQSLGDRATERQSKGTSRTSCGIAASPRATEAATVASEFRVVPASGHSAVRGGLLSWCVCDALKRAGSNPGQTATASLFPESARSKPTVRAESRSRGAARSKRLSPSSA